MHWLRVQKAEGKADQVGR